MSFLYNLRNILRDKSETHTIIFVQKREYLECYQQSNCFIPSSDTVC